MGRTSGAASGAPSVTSFRIRILPRASRQIDEISAWWAVNRRASPQLFADELNAVFALLSTFPYSGKLVSERRPHGHRRILLKTSLYHVFYGVDIRREAVHIDSVRGAIRNRRPPPS